MWPMLALSEIAAPVRNIKSENHLQLLEIYLLFEISKREAVLIYYTYDSPVICNRQKFHYTQFRTVPLPYSRWKDFPALPPLMTAAPVVREVLSAPEFAVSVPPATTFPAEQAYPIQIKQFSSKWDVYLQINK